MFAFVVATAFSALYSVSEEKSFLSFMRESNQFYTGDEYNFRLGVYTANARRVSEFNREGNTFEVALNKFSAYTPAEYKSLLGARSSNKVTRPSLKTSTVSVPESFDWREKNVVYSVKDQAQCGSCWAFSIIAAQESAWAIAKGELISLSEQNIVDCVTSCYGCNGGWPYKAYDYVIKKQGGKFMKEEDYPYKAVDQSCKFDASKAVTMIKSYVSVESGSESDLKEKVATKGVASICIDASNWSFQMYSKGIYDESSCSSYNLDHAVNCVGYGSENGVDYWIVRNSWGTSWGENGYIRMIRNKNNQCGEASEAIVPLD